MSWTRGELYQRYAKSIKPYVEVEADVLRETARILKCSLTTLVRHDGIGLDRNLSSLYQRFDYAFTRPLDTEADFIRATANILKESFDELLHRIGIASLGTSQSSAPKTHGAFGPISDSTNSQDIRHESAGSVDGFFGQPPTPVSPGHHTIYANPATMLAASTGMDSTLEDDITRSGSVPLNSPYYQPQYTVVSAAGDPIHPQTTPGIFDTTSGAQIPRDSTKFDYGIHDDTGRSIDRVMLPQVQLGTTEPYNAAGSHEEFVQPEPWSDPEYPIITAYNLPLDWSDQSQISAVAPHDSAEFASADSNQVTLATSSINSSPPRYLRNNPVLASFSQGEHLDFLSEWHGASRSEGIATMYMVPSEEESSITTRTMPSAVTASGDIRHTNEALPYMHNSLNQWRNTDPETNNLEVHPNHDQFPREDLANLSCTKTQSRIGVSGAVRGVIPNNPILTGRIKKPAPRGLLKQRKISICSNQTVLTSEGRQACVRCVLHHMKCIIDPGNSVCRRCLGLGPKAFFAPCLVLSITDIEIYRTDTTLPQWKRFPFRGEAAGKLNMIQHWEPLITKSMELSQGRGGSIQLRLNRFEVPDGIPHLEKTIFKSPWGLSEENFEAAKDIVDKYVDRCMTEFAQQILPQTNETTWNVFELANSLATKRSCRMLKATLRLWTAARCIEARWYQCAPNHGPDLEGLNPNDAPDVPDHQLAVIVIIHVLDPLRKEIFDGLNRLYTKTGKQPIDKLVVFLTSYILLHNLELLMKQQGDVAREREFPFRFTNMRLIKSLQLAAHCMLAYFHVMCGKDSILTICNRAASEWLDTEDNACMEKIIESVQKHRDQILGVTKSDGYEDMYYFTGQCFDPRWEPRPTLDQLIPA